MKFNEFCSKFKEVFDKNQKNIYIVSLIITLLFSILNRILGILKHSIWHETISIYYFILVIIKGILVIFIFKNVSKEKEVKIYGIIKLFLIILNIFLIIPIFLLIMDKRVVEMTLIPSIAIALYVTIKTSVVITQFIKKRKNESPLFKELRTINLMDVVVSILTLTNTLISVNTTTFDIGLYYLTIIVSIVGYVVNIFLLTILKKQLKFCGVKNN